MTESSACIRRVCVYCASSMGRDEDYAQSTRQFADALVAERLELVYGGARNGLMGVLADRVLARGGRVTGVMPQGLAKWELAHEALSELFVVDSMHARKAKMADSADAFVALPGGIGTLEEIFEMLSWAQLGIHRKPCALLNVKGFYDPLIEFLDHSVAQGVIKPASRQLLLVADEPGQLIEQLRAYRSPVRHRWLSRDET